MSNLQDWWDNYVCPVCNNQGYPSMSPEGHKRHPGGCCTSCANQYATLCVKRVSLRVWWKPRTWYTYRIERHLMNGEVLSQ